MSFKGIIYILDISTSMKINRSKSIVLAYGLQEEVLEQLAVVFPFERKFLDEGLKYMGLMLKPNDY
jgi:hypothetical protein